MEKENIITCPECGAAIDVNEVLYHQLEERIKKEYDRAWGKKEKELEARFKEIQAEKETLAEEKRRFQEQVAEAVNLKVKAEKERLEASLKRRLEEETAEQIQALQKELEDRSRQVKEFNRLKAELERLRLEKEEMQERILLEKEKEFGERLKEERQRIRQLAEEENLLKIKEREKVIEDLKTQLEAAKRKAEQGSVQLQGEVQELELERMLRDLYRSDEIVEIKKGQRGADVLQVVRTAAGRECGKIYYESKRTKGFNEGWLQKLRDDNLEVKADILVLVSETLPEGMDKFGLKEGVWICSFHEVKGLSMVFRQWLIRLHEVAAAQQNKGTKMELLYDYLTGQEFRGQFGAIIEGFRELQKSYHDEKLRLQKIWKEREKQLEKILTNAVDFYGSLKGIAGASIPEIRMLEDSSPPELIE